MKKAGSVVGCSEETFQVVEERRTLNKLLSVTDYQDHHHHRRRSVFSKGPIRDRSEPDGK